MRNNRSSKKLSNRGSTKKMSTRLVIQTVGAVIGIIGLAILIEVMDWRVALGIMLMLWGNNIQLKEKSNEQDASSQSWVGFKPFW